MKHETHGAKHHKHDHGTSYWASWCSPVGLGIFAMTSAIALAVTLYAVLNIIGVVISLSQQQQSYSAQEMQQGAMTAPGSGDVMMHQ